MIEKVIDEPKNADYYRDAIPQAVIDFFKENGVDQQDIKNEPLNIWSACMRFCNRECVSREDLKTDEYVFGNNGSKAKRYNEKLVGELVDIFLGQCELYDKVPSAWAFSLLTGIERSTLEEWRGQYKREVTSGRSDIMKKIGDARETALSNRIIDGRKNPVGSIAALNFEFGWTQKSEVIHISGKIPTSAELPVFTDEIPEITDNNGITEALLPVLNE